MSLAYAFLAGLPAQVGIYGYLLGGIGYALFDSSRKLAVGANRAISDLRMLTLSFCSETPTASPSKCDMRVRGEWQNRTVGRRVNSRSKRE